MQRQLKQSKLQPLKRDNSYRDKSTILNKDTHSGKFKPTHISQRFHKTQPSVQNIRQELPKKHSKNRTEFSEEYMSLVNKLRVNLSRQLQKKDNIEVIRQRQYMFNNENKERNSMFINGNNYPRQKYPFFPKENLTQLKKRSLTTFQRNVQPQVKTLRDHEVHHKEESFFKSSHDIFKKQTYLPLMNSLQKGRYQLNDVIKEVTQHNSPQKIKKGTKKKYKTSKKAKPQKVFIYNSNQKPSHAHNEPQNSKQLNQSYSKLDELCFHIQIIIDIFQKMNGKDSNQQKPDTIIRILKDYILGNKKYTNLNAKIVLDDISHLDRIYIQEKNQKCLRTMIFYERILIIYCIDLMANRTIDKYQHDINHILHSFLGIYLYFLLVLKEGISSQYSLKCLDNFQSKISEHNIHIKREIQTTVFFISKKLFSILKSNLTLFKQIKVLVVQFQNRNVTINRSFYQLLRLYAIYLNNNEGAIEKYYTILKTFATCPSPYLTKPAKKKYTLVLDLDETLIHSHRQKQKLQIFMRPYVKEFLQVMSKNYQIVIFTSSMPEYSEQIISQLPFISHKLYRYHTTRLKHRHIKDLSRLGRPIQTIVMVDNEEQNFILQKENGIKISDWRGEDPLDQQLNILGLFLNGIASRGVSDVRDHLQEYKQFRREYE